MLTVKIHKMATLTLFPGEFAWYRIFFFFLSHLTMGKVTICLRNIQLQTSVDLEEAKEKAACELLFIICLCRGTLLCDLRGLKQATSPLSIEWPTQFRAPTSSADIYVYLASSIILDTLSAGVSSTF